MFLVSKCILEEVVVWYTRAVVILDMDVGLESIY